MIFVASPSFSKNEILRKEVLKYFPDASFNDKGQIFNTETLSAKLSGVKGLICGLDKVNANLLDNCPEIEIVSKYGVGLDNIDVDECERRNIKIGWTPGTNKLGVAELAVSFMLDLCRNVHFTSSKLKNGTWLKNGGVQLSGKTVGIIGMGNIGKELVRLLKPFNCKILVNDIIDQAEYYTENSLTECTKNEIYKNSDIVTLHVPHNDLTDNMINTSTLSIMKETAFLINTARGSIVNEKDLKEALNNGIINGCALDVYQDEPPSDMELLKMENLICTPHIGGNSFEAILSMGMSAIEHMKRHFKV